MRSEAECRELIRVLRENYLSALDGRGLEHVADDVEKLADELEARLRPQVTGAMKQAAVIAFEAVYPEPLIRQTGALTAAIQAALDAMGQE